MLSTELNQTSPLYPAIPANHEQQIEEFILPSEGEVKDWINPDAECGKTKTTRKCDDKHKCDYPVVLIPWDCGRYECPVCYPRALKKGAVGIREHVWNTLVEMKKAYPSTKWRLDSTIISAPPEFAEWDYDKQHYYLRKSLKHLGTEDVAAIYHPFRFRDMVTGEELESIPWKEYKKNPDRFKRVKSPHWHCFTIGRLVKSAEYFEKTGLVYKKKSSKNQGGLTKKDVYQIAYYALSHAGLSTTKRRHAVHYYGNFWRLEVIEKRTDFEPVICPKCNNQRVDRQEYHDMYGDDCYGVETPAVRAIVHRKYRLRGIKYKDMDDGLDFTGIDAPVKEVDYVEFDDL